MNEELEKEIEELKGNIKTNNKNKRIKNLKVNTKKFIYNIPYVIAVAVPLTITKVAFNDIPFIRNDGKYYRDTITTIDSNENISYQESYTEEDKMDSNKMVITITEAWEQDETGKYYRSIKEYEVNETLNNLILYAKEDPEVLKEMFGKPTNEVTENKSYVGESEILEGTSVKVDIYEQDKKHYIYAKESIKSNIKKTIGFIVATIVTLLLANEFVRGKKDNLEEYIEKMNQKYPTTDEDLKKQLKEKEEEYQKVLTKN